MESGRVWRWRLTALGLNLALGVPGIVPVWLVWYVLSNARSPMPD